MSLMYVFTPYNLIFSSANQPLSPSGDLILMANDTTGGVADDSRMTALCDWDILIDSNFGNSSSGASRSSIRGTVSRCSNRMAGVLRESARARVAVTRPRK